MGKLDELLDTLRNDNNWNTQNKDGTHRFDKEIIWIESMIKDYAEKLKMPVDRIVEIMEKNRDYSWPNYYQPCNFPGIESDSLIGVFSTFEDYKKHSDEKYTGYKCGKCGTVGSHPQECEHRIKKDGKCDWTSYGLFKSGTGIIVIEAGLKTIPIFEPVLREESL